VVCLAITVAGAILIGVTVNNHEFIGYSVEYNANSLYFAVACACFINFALLVNAGRQYPASLPIALGVSYFWFPEAITLADTWRLDLDQDGSNQVISTRDLRFLLSGIILSLFGSSLGVLFEVLLPKGTPFAGIQPFQIIGFIAFLIALGGCLLIWIENPRSFADYEIVQRISIQGGLSTVFALDAILFPDQDLIITASFMATYTFCQALFEGLPFQDQSDKLTEHAEAGLCIMSFGLIFLVVVLGMTKVPKETAL